MRHPIALILALGLAAPVVAGSSETPAVTLGDLRIEAPMLRATPPNAPVAGGFLRIENTGGTDDTLVAAAISGDVAREVELHEMAMEDGVMSMFEVEGGIEVPAGETVALVPGGLHIMLMGLQAPLDAGGAHSVTLIFAEAGEVTLDFPVLTLPEIREAVEAAGYGAMHGEHGATGIHQGN
jgi:copper(I)-binding protein